MGTMGRGCILYHVYLGNVYIQTKYTYVGHLRSFVYSFIVIAKYKMITVLIFLNVYTYVLYSL